MLKFVITFMFLGYLRPDPKHVYFFNGKEITSKSKGALISVYEDNNKVTTLRAENGFVFPDSFLKDGFFEHYFCRMFSEKCITIRDISVKELEEHLKSQSCKKQ